jgi:hypothetical protein
MGHLQRRGLTVAAAILVTGCWRSADMITTGLVDPRPSVTWPGTDLYLIEVHRTPLPPFPGFDRFWKRPVRVDTVPGIRTFGPVTVVDEHLVIGFHGGDGGAPGVFQYDAVVRRLTRTALPAWLAGATFAPPPQFAPGGRHVLSLVRRPGGMMRVEVHSWPDGAEVVVGLPLQPNPQSSNPMRISWWTAAEFSFSVPVASDTGPIVLLFKGHVSGTQAWLDSGARYADVKLPDSPRGLPPSALPTLPRAFRAELERRGCTVQQSHRSENVISGHFAAATQVDWAVLCSQRGHSTILVYWGGAAQCPRELRPAPDYQYQLRAGDRVLFVRSIHTTDRYQVHDEAGRPVIPERFVRLEHEAIEDLYEGAASTVWSCQEGKWIEFPGRGSRKP